MRRILPLSALLICSFALSTAVLTVNPASAQPAPRPKMGQAPAGGEALQRWCRQAVFYKYGHEGQNPYMNLSAKGRLIFMDADTEFRATQLCVQTRGTNY